MSFSWDWYQATLSPDTSLHDLRYSFQELLGEPRVSGGFHGYAVCEDFIHAKIQHGGHSGQFGPHITIHGGDLTDRLVWHLRHYHPDHHVTRFDVCADFCCPGAWDWAVDLGLAIVDDFGLDSQVFGDWHSGKKGRTLYIGSKKSTHFCRIYEKGHQMRQLGLSDSADLNWVRLEFVVRPSKPTRFSASKKEPLEVAHSSSWTYLLSKLFGSYGLKSSSLSTSRKKPAILNSLEHMFYQYASLLKKAVDDQVLTEQDLIDAVKHCVKYGSFESFPPLVFRDWYFDPASTKSTGGHLIQARVWQESKS